MRKRKLIVALAATTVALVAAGGVTAAVAEPADGGAIDEKVLTEKLEALAATADTSVVAEVRSGDEVWTDAVGERVDGGDEAVETTDRVRIASLTKSMLTTVVLQLVADDKLSLDDSVQKLAPDLLPYDDEITVRQLLGHTSGIPDYFSDIYPSLLQGSPADLETNRLDEYTPRELVDTAGKHPLEFAPGTAFAYSNTGYIVLGLLVEQLTGNSFEDELTTRVLEPAGMDNSYLPETDPAIEGEHPNSYFETGAKPGEKRIDTTEISPTQLWAAGVTVSTMDDVNRFFRAMFDGTLLPQKLLDEAQQLSDLSEGAYGLGLQAVPADCEAVPGGNAIGHTGGALGHTTYSFHSPDGKTQATFTFSADGQLLPPEAAQQVNDAALALGYAGLCGAEAPKSFDASGFALLDAIATRS